MSAVALENISFSYPSLKVFDGLNLTVDKGVIFGLLGPNGGGKSTLFKILSTLAPVSQGHVLIDGLDAVKDPARVRHKIGVVFQNPGLDKKLTLYENLWHQGRLYGMPAGELRARIETLLSQFSLSNRRDDVIEHLSGGLQRRAEIIKGLLHNPPVLILDEPSAGLDPAARRELWDVLGQCKRAGVTVLLTTHLMEEADRCDRLMILNRGRCVAMGTPNELKAAIGGDVISIHSSDPKALMSGLAETFSLNGRLVDGVVHVEIADGHMFIPRVVNTFPALITSLTLGKPTLEDVFIHETGEVMA